jgi:hypothetical protein
MTINIGIGLARMDRDFAMSAAGSSAPVLVIAARDEVGIARRVRAVLGSLVP